MMTVASNTSHGTNCTKLRLPVRLRSSAPTNPPSTLGIRSNHNQPLPRTPVNRFRVRQTAVGYAKNSATALVASAITGGRTSISSGKVINPPPPAIALMAPPTMLARKNNKYVSIIHASILLLMLMHLGRDGAPRRPDIAARCRYCPVIHGNASRSTFPPEITIPTRLPATSIFPS